MYNRFGYPGLFAVYNAGLERYDAWVQHGTPLPAETLAYLRAISSDVAESVLAMGRGERFRRLRKHACRQF